MTLTSQYNDFVEDEKQTRNKRTRGYLLLFGFLIYVFGLLVAFRVVLPSVPNRVAVGLTLTALCVGATVVHLAAKTSRNLTQARTALLTVLITAVVAGVACSVFDVKPIVIYLLPAIVNGIRSLLARPPATFTGDTTP